MDSAQTDRLWAIVPAAGTGSRMGADRPKQYLEIGGRPIIEYSVRCLLAVPTIQRVIVAIAPGDRHWRHTGLSRDPRVEAVTGGAQRADSVTNALRSLNQRADDGDWVLVHDAARPCLEEALLRGLIDELRSNPVGGLLAVPVQDTVKRADEDNRVLATLSRESLWLAQTPQMFRLGLLRTALESAQAAGLAVTDECSAVEHLGHRPRLVAGNTTNLKVTRRSDLDLAAYHLAASSGNTTA